MSIEQPPSESAGFLDALHVPTIVATSDYDLIPGQHVKFTFEDITNGLDTVEPAARSDFHGIVNPFDLRDTVPKWQRVLVFLAPEMTSRLGHHFDVTIGDETSTYEDSVGADGSVHDDGCRGCY